MKLVPKVTLKEMLTNGSLRRPLVIAMMMMLAQQLSGINCAIFYSTKIFEIAGLGPEESQSATLGMGSMNVVMTFISLVLIEKAGRKTLMLIGLCGMFLMTTLLLASLLTFVRTLNPKHPYQNNHVSAHGHRYVLCCYCCCYSLRCRFCHWSRLNSLVLCNRIVRPVRTTHRHIHCCNRQLVSKLPSWPGIRTIEGNIKILISSLITILSCFSASVWPLGVHGVHGDPGVFHRIRSPCCTGD